MQVQGILKIVGMVGELAKAIDHILLASPEQMQRISQVSIAVSQIDEGTKNNAALVKNPRPPNSHFQNRHSAEWWRHSRFKPYLYTADALNSGSWLLFLWGACEVYMCAFFSAADYFRVVSVKKSITVWLNLYA